MKGKAGALLRGGHSERQVARLLGSANGCAEAVSDLAEQAGEPASVGEGSVPGSESGHSFAPASHEGGKFGIAGGAGFSVRRAASPGRGGTGLPPGPKQHMPDTGHMCTYQFRLRAPFGWTCT
jgi:hypothetical protein